MYENQKNKKQKMLKVNIGGYPIYYYPMSEERANQIREHARNNPVVKICRTRKELHDWMFSVLKELD